MSKNVHEVIAGLFASDGQPQAANFDLRLIRRRGRPFLLLPDGLTAARTGLNIYSAQRRRARIWRQCLPVLFQTPLARLFRRIHFQANASSEIVQFMAQQAGVPADQISAAAIKLSEVGLRSRLVLLVCDEGGRPARVIKAGLNAIGREANDREADFLAQLPAGKIGCARLTGRLTTPTLSAFATDYFPGSSPRDDAGLEHLFHDWLNRNENLPLASLPVWRELDAAVGTSHRNTWQQINTRLAGKNIHTTLYHGDFAPWNIRAVNSRNLQAFDWERGSRHGIPGWDWFHFTIQTAILARRYSAERAAAEVEQLIHSQRFKKYADDAGIAEIVQPLILAYLLNHIWVTQPSEGGKTNAALFDLLCGHWLKATEPAAVPFAPSDAPATGLWAAARRQLDSASRQWRNLFWEPTLNSKAPSSWSAEFQAHWFAVLGTGLLLTVIGILQFHTTSHLMFLPFYVATCALLTLKAGRRWGALSAAAAAVIAPLVVAARDADFRDPEVMVWNTIMRLIILEMCVFFVDRIHTQQAVHHRPAKDCPPAKPSENWAVLLACGLYLAIVAWLDYITNPHLIFLPLYLFPCMMLTLVLNFRWGVAVAVLSIAVGTTIESLTSKLPQLSLPEVFVWNFMMRLVICLLVLALLNRIRKENILFIQR
jgi:hypothetical protein